MDGILHWLPERFEARVGDAGGVPIADVALVAPDLDLEIWIETFVDADAPILIRRVQVTNRGAASRSLSLYFHHDFRLADGRPLETARRDDESGGILHASGRRAALFQLETPEGMGVPLVRTSAREREASGGADAEAEAGAVEPRAAATGWADSVGGAPLSLPAGSAAMVTASLSFGATPDEVRAWSARFHEEGVARSLARTRARWNLWSSQGARDFADLPEDVGALFAQSLVHLRLHQAPGGAIVAGVEEVDGTASGAHAAEGDARWCRVIDGAIAADALGRAGYLAAARRFLEFVHGAAGGGPLGPVYEASGTAVPTARDEEERPLAAAFVLLAAARHFDRERDVEFLAPLWQRLLEPEAARLASLAEPPMDLPVTGDWWRERRGVHAPAAAAIRGALRAAARLAAYLGQATDARSWTLEADRIGAAIGRRLRDPATGGFARSLDRAPGGSGADTRADASLLLIGLLDDFEPEDPRVRATVEGVRRRLWGRSGAGGISRYEGDSLRGGDDDRGGRASEPHVAPTLWLAMHEARAARRLQDLEPVRTFLFWAAARAGGERALPERLPPARGRVVGAAPSLQAHAWFVHAALDYAERFRLLTRCERCGEPAPARRERRRAERVTRRSESLPGIVADL